MPHRVHPGSPACRFDCLHSHQHMQSDHICDLTGSRPLLQKSVCPSFQPKGRQRRKWSRRDLEAMLEHHEEPVALAPASPRTPSGRPILVVDDDPSIAGFVRCTLEEEGHSVVVAATGVEALATAQTAHPWLVLLDIGLPQMDGWTVADHLQSTLGEGCRLVLMSGQRTNPERAQLLGAADWLSKPFGVGDLLSCVGQGPLGSVGRGPRSHDVAI